jgi:hypothetical protein
MKAASDVVQPTTVSRRTFIVASKADRIKVKGQRYDTSCARDKTICPAKKAPRVLAGGHAGATLLMLLGTSIFPSTQ